MPMDSMIYKSPNDEPMGSVEELIERLSNINIGPEHAGGTMLYGPGVTVRFLGPENALLEERNAEVLQIDIQCTHDLESEIARLTLERVEEHFAGWERAFEIETDSGNDETDFWELDEFQDD
tara:strand:+ start:408 stop:773 length:366 start_codon:yes stop_codon:yes gene_type:complete